MPDISLYDHLKTTAAIASCLWYFHAKESSFEKKDIRDKDKEKFILFAADLSGIQNYIFDLVHTGIKRLAKILRARSFYLSAIPKLLITRILTDLNLTPANAVLDSGGRIILLLPNTIETQDYLKNIEKEVKKWCLKEFYGELTINFSYKVKLKGEDFASIGFSEKLDVLNNDLEIKKLQKYSVFSEADFKENLFVLDADYDTIVKNGGKVCSITGKKPADIKYSEKLGVDISKNAYMLMEVGKNLTRSSYFMISNISTADSLSFLDSENALYIHLFKDIDKAFSNPGLIDIEQFRFDKDDIRWVKRTHYAHYVPTYNYEDIHKYRRYADEHFTLEDQKFDDEINEGFIKTFNLIAVPKNKIFAESPDNKGVDMLGIIKADVDNLGRIFSQGLKGLMSISRYSTLSRSLNLFFCGYLNTLLRDEFPDIYTVFAGGDDLFMIGHWEEIYYFAQRMNLRFEEFTCRNPDIHISAGISLAKPRQPIRKAAAVAEDQLTLAKKQTGKNRISLYGEPLKWDELSEINQWYNFFVDITNDSKSEVNNAFLYRLLMYHYKAKQYFDEGTAEGLMYLAHLSYDIKRNIAAKKNINPDVLSRLVDLTKIENGKSAMKNIHIPIMMTLYKNRGGTNG